LPSFKYNESDLEKKLRRLEHFSSGKIDKNYIERALNLADGNPRLLEWLNNEVLSAGNIDTKLRSFENETDVTWRDKIVWRLEEKPQLLTDEALEKVVSNCLIYEIPVPFAALEAVCQSVPNYQKKLQQAQDKGLIEVIHNDDRETLYRASHIKHINPHIELPKDASNLSALAGTAAKALTELWGNKENKNEAMFPEPGNINDIRWGEIFRLAFAETENSDRFREQFDKMISVQYNNVASQSYYEKLRKQRKYLEANQEQIYQKLEEYLGQQDWKKADYETTFIMYQLAIKNSLIPTFAPTLYFHNLFTEVSLEIIDEIDRLWMKYSKGKFGLKGQAKIYRDLGGTEEYNEEVWERFGDRVGWREGGRWLELEEVAYHATTQPENHLPIFMHYYSFGGGQNVPFLIWLAKEGGFERAHETRIPGWATRALLSRQDLKDCSI